MHFHLQFVGNISINQSENRQNYCEMIFKEDNHNDCEANLAAEIENSGSNMHVVVDQRLLAFSLLFPGQTSGGVKL